jgi:large subunit ribosomal protein L35
MKKKIKRSVSRRFKITKTGKVMFAHQYGGHLKINKSASRKRRQKEPGQLSPVFAKKIKQMLGAR